MGNPSPADDMDSNIVLLFQLGDKNEYLKLYNRYAPAVLGVLTRILGDKTLAEECVNESFCRVWQTRMDYNPQKERVFTFVLKVAKEIAGKKGMDKGVNLNEQIREEIDMVYATDIKSYLRDKQRTEGDNFALGIDQNIREAIDLIYFRAYTFSAAANALDIPVEQLRAEMIKTIKRLKGSVLA